MVCDENVGGSSRSVQINIHTLHSPVLCLCWPLGCLVVSLCLWVPFLEQGVFTHLFRLVVFDPSLGCMLPSRSL